MVADFAGMKTSGKGSYNSLNIGGKYQHAVR